MVNCYNSFDKLKEIVLGDIDEQVLNYCDKDQYQRLSHIIEKTKKELNNFQTQLESYGVTVHRPKFFENMCVDTPYWSSKGLKIPLTPRDNFLVVGNTIIETASWQKERFFESFYYRDIFLKYFESGSNWISMPMPRHEAVDIDPLDIEEIPNNDPLIDAANCLKYGKDIFVSISGSNNRLGVQWLEKNLPDYNLHYVSSEVFSGHLDTHFNILRPGLVYTYHDRSNLPEYFNNWDIIQIDKSRDQEVSLQQSLYDDKIQDDDFVNTVLGINVLSLDREKIFLYDHLKENKSFLNQLEKYKIEPIFVPFTYSHFFNQGLSCITLDTVRETDGCIDYKNQ